jgi:hypothetical protein
MIENPNAEQGQIATDNEEININVVKDNYDEEGNAVAQPTDELDTYTKNVSRRINKLNQKHREAEARARQLEQYAREKEQELEQYRQYTTQMNESMVKVESDAIESKEAQVDQIYKQAVESNDAELMSKATSLKNELAIQKEKLRMAKQRQEQEKAQNEQWQAQQKVQPQQPQQAQQPQQYEEPDSEPTAEATGWHAQNSWYGDDSDPKNIEATQYAYYTHFNLINEGYEADSDEYYEALDSRVEKAYPHTKSAQYRPSESSADEKGQRSPVQRVASTQHSGRQQTRGSKKGDVHFSQSELQRLRGLKPHNMSEQQWLQRVAQEKQKKLNQGVR